MILSDQAILTQLENRSLSISPLEKGQIQPASVDIRLGNTFSVIEDSPLRGHHHGSGDHLQDHPERYLRPPARAVHPGHHHGVLRPPGRSDRLRGRPQLPGADGPVHSERGLGRPRLQGEITLELFNANRCAIKLQSGRRVGQLVFARMDTQALHPYRGKYQGQKGATGSRVYLDHEK